MRHSFSALVRKFAEAVFVEPAHPPDFRTNAYLGLCDRFWMVDPRALVGLELLPLPDTRFRQYLKIRKFIHLEQLPEKNLLAYKAFLLFGNVENLLRFYKSSPVKNKNFKSPDLTPLLERLSFPDHEDWGKVDFKKWREAFYKFGYSTHAYFSTISPYFAPVEVDGSVSLDATCDKFITTRKNISSHQAQEIISLSDHFNLNENEFLRAAKIFSERTAPSGSRDKFLPDLKIPGRYFGIPGYVFQKLDQEDPRVLFLGDFTDCCERISDDTFNMERTIHHALTTGESGFYVLTWNDQIIAHSWAWRGKNGELVFDGFESFADSGFKAIHLEKIMDALEHHLSADPYRPYGISSLCLGISAEHLDSVRNHYAEAKVRSIKPRDLDGLGMNKPFNQNTSSGMMAVIGYFN